MPDPVMVTMATALVTWATTTVADQARATTTAAVRFLRERFASDPTHRQVVNTALDRASDGQAVERLAGLLEQEVTRDPAFAHHLRVLWDRAANAVGSTDAGPINQIMGNVSGPIVQARDIQGGISFGTSHGPPPSS